MLLKLHRLNIRTLHPLLHALGGGRAVTRKASNTAATKGSYTGRILAQFLGEAGRA